LRWVLVGVHALAGCLSSVQQDFLVTRAKYIIMKFLIEDFYAFSQMQFLVKLIHLFNSVPFL